MTIVIVGLLCAPFYLFVLRFVSREAFDNLFLIMRRVLLPARMNKPAAAAPVAVAVPIPVPVPAAATPAGTTWDFPPRRSAPPLTHQSTAGLLRDAERRP